MINDDIAVKMVRFFENIFEASSTGNKGSFGTLLCSKKLMLAYLYVTPLTLSLLSEYNIEKNA